MQYKRPRWTLPHEKSERNFIQIRAASQNKSSKSYFVQEVPLALFQIFRKLQQNVTAVRNELLDMLKNLNEITTVPASARKRLCLSTEYRRDKRPRLDTQHDQQLTSAYQLSESISQPSAFTPSPTGQQSPSISLASTSQLLPSVPLASTSQPLPSTPSTPLASTSPPSHNVFDLEPDAINTDVTATTNPESVIKSSRSPALSVSVHACD